MFDLAIFINALIALMVVMDPIGVALIFHALIPESLTKHRAKMAVKSIVISLVLLTLFGKFGQPLLEQLGITIDAFRISGGILLFYTAFMMITRDAENENMTGTRDISVYPLSIPLLAGPGSLTLSILLYSQGDSTVLITSITAAILTTCLLTMVLMLLAKHVQRVIGKTGDDILRRFLGVLLAALAIQFIHDGVTNMINAPIL